MGALGHGGRRDHADKRRRIFSGLSALVIMMASLVGASFATAGPAGAAGSTGDGVSYTLEGCRNNGGISLPDGSGKFICPDAAYTTGNLGKGWNELDLVPVRFTVQAGNAAPATQSFSFALVVDNCSTGTGETGCTTGKPGYDVLSSDSGGTPVKNTSLSTGTCGTLTASGPQYEAPGVGGTGTSLYRVMSVTGQAKNSTCVYDAFARLALGSHLFPGSSLHFNLTNDALGTAGIGAKDVSIPVKEILPQELSKTMSAVRDSAYTWTVQKQANPVSLQFADTCDPTTPRTASVDITVTWTKSAANPSGFSLTTVVTAKNPASRTITVQATDKIYAGANLLDTAVGVATDVPANTSLSVLTHTFNVSPATLTGLGVDPNAPNFNDKATATYTDKVTGVAVPGTTEATASVANDAIGSGATAGNSIDISDTESITGTGLDFSVATPSVGSFSGYTAGTYTTGPVVWNLTGQTSTGSVTFHKTVRVAAATATSGTLSDTATGTFGGSTTMASASTSISSTALVDLTINKRRSPVTSEAQTFDFVVKNSSNVTVATPSITVPGGTAANVDTSTTVNDLPPGSYTIDETATGPYPSQSASATINLPSCSGSVRFNNVAAPAGARVQKITVPADPSTVWAFTLSGPDVGASGTETVNATSGAGYVNFTSALDTDGATYTITETAQTGFDLTSVAGDFAGNAGRVSTSTSNRTCSFTLDQPADSGGTFSCTFTNTKRANAKVIKTENGGNPLHAYSFRLTGGPDNVSITRTTDPAAGSGGEELDFGLVKPGSYTLCELAVPAGTSSTLASLPGATTNPTTGDVCAPITLAAGEVRTISVDNSMPGGGQRTIGYWKNWNSCNAKGGDWTARSIRTGNHLLDEFLAQVLGTYSVDTCPKAVNVLSAASGKYAENALAAQLLAAKLNVAAGASTCATVANAITHADALLTGIGYAGPPSSKVGSNHPQRADFLATMTTLDDYNNGLIC